MSGPTKLSARALLKNSWGTSAAGDSRCNKISVLLWCAEHLE